MVMRRLDQLEGYREKGNANHYERVMVRDLTRSREWFVYIVEPNSLRGQEIANLYPVLVSPPLSRTSKKKSLVPFGRSVPMIVTRCDGAKVFRMCIRSDRERLKRFCRSQ